MKLALLDWVTVIVQRCWTDEKYLHVGATYLKPHEHASKEIPFYFAARRIAQTHIAAATKSAIHDADIGALQPPIAKDQWNMTRRMCPADTNTNIAPEIARYFLLSIRTPSPRCLVYLSY